MSIRHETVGDAGERGTDAGERGTDAGEGGTDAGEGDGAAGDRLVLTIEDDGPGIPEHEVAAVESGRETALEHGSGLGLWIVEWAAAAVGADVDYAAREPRGTCVTVQLPIVHGE